MSKPVWLAVAASVLWGVGSALQKHGMTREFPKITLKTFFTRIGLVTKTLLRCRVWMAGLAVIVGGTVCYVYALAQGDLTVVQPLVNLTLVVAALTGVVFLAEKVGALEWAGIGVMLAGVVFLSAGGSEPTSVEPSSLALAVLTGILSLLTVAALSAGKMGLRPEFTLSIAAGCLFGLANIMGKVLTQRVIAEVGEFSLTNPDCWRQILADFPVWIIAVSNGLAGAFSQTAFANGRVSLVSPLIAIVANTLPIVAGVAAFGERMGWARAGGIAAALVGTGMLSLKPPSADGSGVGPAPGGSSGPGPGSPGPKSA